MSSFISFSSCTPCAGAIGDSYADYIKNYQKIVGGLKDQIHNIGQNLSEKIQYSEQKIEECQALTYSNNEIYERLDVLKRINNTMNTEVIAHQISFKERAVNETQTDDEELAQLQAENEDLKFQVQQLLTMAHKAIDKQQKLVARYQNKKEKLNNLRVHKDTLLTKIDISHHKADDLEKKVIVLMAKKSCYKAENKRILMRLAETEGNLQESESMTEYLRNKLNELMEKQQKQQEEYQQLYLERFNK
ncbi:hypothetical protein TRFO_34948 [Tritrichomonas foetus]|uniref:Uncharacterized protein n=1 Tax=Tritrichomonas foetus TaxID=1144522 RepID=A0A1J4JHJ0_9EUKA|nr:hypothetical protein TRFO_34948 [Tritrichomonas foetus]|eukprot:OHS98618.1 hypothetical protein TRFO_34948 [Tritrichomonas foetus]